MSGWFRCLFLFSSFGPLYVLLATSLWVQSLRAASFVALSLAVTSFLVFLFLKRGFRRKSASRMMVEHEGSLDENILAYMVAYIPPVLIDDFSDVKKMLPCVMFYFVTATFMLLVDTLYINPFFLLFGYRVDRVKLESGRRVILIRGGGELASARLVSLYEIQPSRVYFAD